MLWLAHSILRLLWLPEIISSIRLKNALLDIFFSCLYGIHIQRPSVFGLKTGTQYSAKTASEYSSFESLTVCGRFLTVNHRTLRTENHKTITHFVNSLCAGSNYDAWLFAMNYFTLSIFYLFILIITSLFISIYLF